MSKKPTIKINFSEMRKAESPKQFSELFESYNEDEKSHRAAAKEIGLKKVGLIRIAIEKFENSKTFFKELYSRLDNTVRDDADNYYAIVQYFLFPNIKKGEKSKYQLKMINRHTKIQQAANADDWDLDELIEECQRKNGLRGVADRFAKKHKKAKKETKHPENTGQSKNKVTFKKLTVQIEFDETVGCKHMLILAKLARDCKTTKELVEIRGNSAEEIIRTYLKQTRG